MTTELAHAKLSASGSEKWMTCTPSARMEEAFPDEGSEFAREGTFAHAVFEQELLTYFLRTIEPLPNELMHFDSPALRDYVRESVDYCITRIEAARERCKDPVFYVERRLDFSRWVPKGFGTGDFVIITDDLVEVLDLKYGKGIYVDAKNNSQMRLYGLGAYNELSDLYDIQKVRMTVLQPRLGNYSSEELPIADLLKWADDAVVPAAKLAWDGEGTFVPGPHCTSSFCKARYTCPARAEGALAVARQEFGSIEDAQPPIPESLTVERVAELLPKADLVIDWFTDLKAYALKQAEKGTTVPGYKLVEGRSNRKYSDQEAVAKALRDAEVPDEIAYERSLRGITAMTDALGKKKFADVLGELITKPEGKPTLVPEGDKRPALTSRASALDDFSKPV
jgi:hypothetical protein